jgi:hypothetical protein
MRERPSASWRIAPSGRLWVGCFDKDPGVASLLTLPSVVKNSTTTQCNAPVVDNSQLALTLSLVFVPIQSIFYLSRLVAKSMKLTHWGWDDTAITIAYVSYSMLSTVLLRHFFMLTVRKKKKVSVMACLATTVFSTIPLPSHRFCCIFADNLGSFGERPRPRYLDLNPQPDYRVPRGPPSLFPAPSCLGQQLTVSA